MISYIIGEIKYIGEDSFVIENNNIGYLINSSFNTIKTLEINNEFKIFTKMIFLFLVFHQRMNLKFLNF